MDRDAGINACLDAIGATGEAAKAKMAEKRKLKYPARHLHVEWSKKMREVYGEDLEVPPWAGRENGIARALVTNVGGLDKALKIVTHFIETWEARQTSRQMMRGELPSIHLCWASRQKIIAELSGLAKVPMSKEERLSQREFSKEGEALSPKVGWGDMFD